MADKVALTRRKSAQASLSKAATNLTDLCDGLPSEELLKRKQEHLEAKWEAFVNAHSKYVSLLGDLAPDKEEEQDDYETVVDSFH